MWNGCSTVTEKSAVKRSRKSRAKRSKAMDQNSKDAMTTLLRDERKLDGSIQHSSHQIPITVQLFRCQEKKTGCCGSNRRTPARNFCSLGLADLSFHLTTLKRHLLDLRNYGICEIGLHRHQVSRCFALRMQRCLTNKLQKQRSRSSLLNAAVLYTQCVGWNCWTWRTRDADRQEDIIELRKQISCPRSWGQIRKGLNSNRQ